MITATSTPPVDVLVTVDRDELVEGEPLGVHVRLASQRPVVVRGGLVELSTRLTYYHKEGGLYAGSMSRARRRQVHASRRIPGPWPLEPDEEVVVPVSVPVPQDGPGTTRASLVDISWWVTARMHVQEYAPMDVSRPIVVLSRARPLRAVATGPEAADDRRCVRLAFTDVSSRELRPGRPLTGTLLVTPLRPTPVRGVRVDLVLRQQVHHGEWIGDDPTRNPAYQGMERDTVIASGQLFGRTVLAPDAPLRLPFALSPPGTLPAASLDTPNFTLTWMLRAVADRPLRQDPHCELPLHGRTARD